MSYDSKITPSGENPGSGWDDPSRMQPIREATHEYKARLEIQRNRQRAERRVVRHPLTRADREPVTVPGGASPPPLATRRVFGLYWYGRGGGWATKRGQRARAGRLKPSTVPAQRQHLVTISKQ